MLTITSNVFFQSSGTNNCLNMTQSTQNNAPFCTTPVFLSNFYPKIIPIPLPTPIEKSPGRKRSPPGIRHQEYFLRSIILGTKITSPYTIRYKRKPPRDSILWMSYWGFLPLFHQHFPVLDQTFFIIQKLNCKYLCLDPFPYSPNVELCVMEKTMSITRSL